VIPSNSTVVASIRLASLACGAPLCAVIALCGCSSDAAPEPEPTVLTPGAFVAVREDTGIALRRTLDTLNLQEGTRLVVTTHYAVTTTSFDEAREIAKGPEPPIERELAFDDEFQLLQREHRVVWFRTLTAEEEERVP